MIQSATISDKSIIHYSECPLCSSKKIDLTLATEDYSISKEAFDIFRCADCDFHFTQRAPSPAAIAPYYNSEVYISHSDTKKGLVNRLYHTARNIMLKQKYKLVRRLAKGKTILDVGSGTGYFLNYMKQKGYQVTGVEIDSEARKTTLRNFGIEVQAPSFLLNKQLPEKVDIITLWHVLEHLHDLDGYMKSMHQSLKTGGVLLIAVPNHTSYDAQYYGQYWAAYDVPRHLWHFSPKTIVRLANKYDFEVVDQKHLPLDPFYNALLSEKYKSNKLSLIFGGIIGMISLLISFFNPSRSTSPIYILKKKP